MLRRSIIAYLLLTAAILTGCSSSKQDRDESAATLARDVKTTSVELLGSSATEELVGTIAPRNRAEVATKILARIEAIPVKLGSHVAKGDLLAELDMRDIRAREAQARAVSDQAKSELERYQQLLERQLVSTQEYDRVKALSEVASAALGEVLSTLSYARVVAPFAGVVTRKMVDLGDLTVPGSPLFTVEEDASFRMVTLIPESRQSRISFGDTMTVHVSSINVVMKGTVAELSRSADPLSRTYEVKIDLPRTEGLRAGQFGRVRVPADSAAGLFIPAAAVVRRGQLELVYVVSEDARAELRLVRTGRISAEKIEVLAGLAAGERVIVSDQVNLVDGDPIKEIP